MTRAGFYRILADPHACLRWYLAAPLDAWGREVDPRLFTQGERVSVQGPLEVPLRRQGEVVSFNFGDFDMVVTPVSLNARLESLAGNDVQRIPVKIPNRVADDFEILNVCRAVSCVDESHSDFVKWSEADGRPEKVGAYRMITKLCLRSDAAAGHDIFRVAEWPIALIVSERVKKLFEELKITGIKCQRVT